jgi:hypothetical protein
MFKTLVVVGILGLFLQANLAHAEVILLPIAADSIEIDKPGTWGAAMDASYHTDLTYLNSRNLIKSGIVCDDKQHGNSEIVVLIVFGKEITMHMDPAACVEQLTKALDLIKSGKASGLKIIAKDNVYINSIAAY